MMLGGLAGAISLAWLQGCGTVEIFGRYDIPESPEVAEAPYPRLVDTPEAPPPGSYDEDVPDPVVGTAILVDLTEEARASARRAAILNDPVLTDAERVALLRRARQQRRR